MDGQSEQLARTLRSIERAGLLEPHEVHLATGMVIAQLGISPADALARIRTLARLSGQTTTHIARLVLARSLRLGADEAIHR